MDWLIKPRFFEEGSGFFASNSAGRVVFYTNRGGFYHSGNAPPDILPETFHSMSSV
jgi:hypothetical protein